MSCFLLLMFLIKPLKIISMFQILPDPLSQELLPHLAQRMWVVVGEHVIHNLIEHRGQVTIDLNLGKIKN